MSHEDHEDTLRRLRAICLALPETSEVSSWGHPNFRAGKRTFVAYERIGGQPSIAFRLTGADVDRLLKKPGFLPTPYGRGLWVSLSIAGPLSWRTIGDLVERSYRLVALKRMIKALESDAKK
jgi:predicted DNA-binding protein (MmcQ/YjbR family)